MIQTKLSNLKTKFIALPFVFCFVILFFSCQSKTERRLIGLWALELDSCIIMNREWYYCGNMLSVSNDNSCKLPAICNQIDKNKGTWQFFRGKNAPDTILFNVPENPLRGQYIVTFYKDYNVMKFKMKLQNDSTVLICSKNIISFDSNNYRKILDSQ